MSGEVLKLQMLGEAHAVEAALTQTLGGHAAAAPDGAFADVVTRQVEATRSHAERAEARLEALGDHRKGRRQAYAVAQSALGQLAAAGRGPIDRLLGAGTAVRVLRNAREAAAAAAYAMATYEALEALAEATGDGATADLARQHREVHERFFTAVSVLVPELTRATLGPAPSPEVQAATQRARDAAAAVRAEIPTDPREEPSPSDDPLPIDGYARLRATEVVPRLDGLSVDELEAIERYERTHRCRRRVLDEISRLREERRG